MEREVGCCASSAMCRRSQESAIRRDGMSALRTAQSSRREGGSSRRSQRGVPFGPPLDLPPERSRIVWFPAGAGASDTSGGRDWHGWSGGRDGHTRDTLSGASLATWLAVGSGSRRKHNLKHFVHRLYRREGHALAHIRSQLIEVFQVAARQDHHGLSPRDAPPAPSLSRRRPEARDHAR